MSFGEDAQGEFAILQETEISDSDGFVFAVAPEYDEDLGSQWGYQVCLRRNETSDRDPFNGLLKLKGVDPNSVNLIIPPRQLISIYFDPRGVKDGSAQLNPVEGGSSAEDPQAGLTIERVRSSGTK